MSEWDETVDRATEAVAHHPWLDLEQPGGCQRMAEAVLQAALEGLPQGYEAGIDSWGVAVLYPVEGHEWDPSASGQVYALVPIGGNDEPVCPFCSVTLPNHSPSCDLEARRKDTEFMDRIHRLIERDRPILEALRDAPIGGDDDA